MGESILTNIGILHGEPYVCCWGWFIYAINNFVQNGVPTSYGWFPYTKNGYELGWFIETTIEVKNNDDPRRLIRGMISLPTIDDVA